MALLLCAGVSNVMAADTDATVTWAFSADVTTVTATPTSIKASCTVSDSLTVATKKYNNVTYVNFQPTSQQAEPTTLHMVKWNITVPSGYTFTPSTASANVCRFGTDGGLIDIAYSVDGGDEVTLETGIRPQRNKSEASVAGVASFSETISDATASSTFTLIAYIYSLGNTKQVGFNNVVITGTLSGEDSGGDSGETTASSNTAPAIWTPASYAEAGTVAAGTTLVDDGLLTMKTVYDATVKSQKVDDEAGTGMIGGKTFDSYIQVRIDKINKDNPAGTKKNNECTSIIVTPKTNIKFVIYDRRQLVDNKTIDSNDGKDVLLVNQSDVSKTLTADDFSYAYAPLDKDDQVYKYAYSRKSYTLEANNTYTLYAGGTTMQVYGIAYGPSTIDVTIGSIGYATFGTNALDYAVSGSAYTATVGETEVTLGDAVTVIPDSVGVILKGDANSTITLTASDEFTSTAASDLIPSDESLTGNGSYYVLGENNGEAVFGPLKSDVAMKPIKAYFVKENGSAKYNIVEPGDATGINEVGSAATSGKAYNLQGIEVGDNFKGLYIKNGKKVIK